MIVADTSVLAAAFASWHEAHAVADERLGSGSRLVGHTAFELVSTMSRLPEPYRVGAAPVLEFLDRRTTKPWLTLPAGKLRMLLRSATAVGVTGGALYDALIGVTAASSGAVLLTLDRRAEGTYRKLGVDFEVLAAPSS